MTAIVASIASLKGGVGKTTTTANLGATIADTYKQRVLIADADPQGHLSDWFGVKRRPGMGFAELLNPPMTDAPSISDVLVQPADDVSLWVLPTSYTEMDEVEARMSSDPTLGGIWAMHRAIQPVLDDFDLILLDTRPTLGNLTSAAMCASNVVLPITEPRIPSFQSTIAAVSKAERIKAMQNPALVVTGWILNKWEEHEEGREVAEQMRKKNIAAFQPAIGVGEYIPKAYMYGNPSVWQFPNHRGPHRNYAGLAGNILAAMGLRAGVA